jgi:predicted small lipoprotein YifL
MSWLIEASRRLAVAGRWSGAALVVAATVSALAACGTDGSVPGPSSPPAAATPSGPGVPQASPTDTSGLTGDVPPSGDAHPSAGRTSAPVAGVPSACGLVTEADLTALTGGVVTLSFDSPAREQTGTDVLTGASSTCRRPLHSTWTDASGTAQLGGSVVVTIQSAGADLYFPVQVGEPVTGLGDDAMSRGARLYVRLGAGLLIVSVGISSPTPDPTATELGWARQLATIALRRLGR